ncbi:hypothetical protein [Candidatus Scalindua japonica]|uniref:hypothetical protein n=1 Tax=Candidatus Scalindua japonica TaxID=1284222 RepID=UPI0013A575DC|nr:hypothetical protein [Candidatus Scalindua japonica]
MRDEPQSEPFVGQARCLGAKHCIRKYLMKITSLFYRISYEAKEVDFSIAVVML